MTDWPDHMGDIAAMSPRDRAQVARAWEDLAIVLAGVPATQRALIESQVITDPDDRTGLAFALSIYRLDAAGDEKVDAADLSALDRLVQRLAADSAEALALVNRLASSGSAAALYGYADFSRSLGDTRANVEDAAIAANLARSSIETLREHAPPADRVGLDAAVKGGSPRRAFARQAAMYWRMAGLGNLQQDGFPAFIAAAVATIEGGKTLGKSVQSDVVKKAWAATADVCQVKNFR